MQNKQVHNRKQGKKQLAKLQAKRIGKKPKGGFKAKKPKGLSQKIIKMDNEIRSQGSRQAIPQRMELESAFMKRLRH